MWQYHQLAIFCWMGIFKCGTIWNVFDNSIFCCLVRMKWVTRSFGCSNMYIFLNKRVARIFNIRRFCVYDYNVKTITNTIVLRVFSLDSSNKFTFYCALRVFNLFELLCELRFRGANKIVLKSPLSFRDGSSVHREFLTFIAIRQTINAASNIVSCFR